MIGQLQLFTEPNEDSGQLRHDRAMGRKDGRSCCFGEVEEPEWRKGIAAEYDQKRATLEHQHAKIRNSLLADVARADAEATTAIERRAATQTECLEAESELKLARAWIRTLVLRGKHVADFDGEYAAGSRMVERIQQRLQNAACEHDLWYNAETAARRNLQECTTRLDDTMRIFDADLRNLRGRKRERLRQYDLGYLETHPHNPRWL